MVAISFALGYSASEIATSETVFYIGAYISKVLQFLIAIIITQNKKAVLLPANNRYHLVLLVIVWTCVGLSFGNMLLVIQSDSSASLIHLLSEIAVATLSVLMFYVFQSFQIHALQKERTALIEQQLWQEEQRFSLIDEQFQEIRSIKHDLTIHMTSIRKLLHEDNNSAAIEYLDDYFSQTSHALTRSITSKPSVDALISEKAAIAESEGVKFDIETEKLATININPVHLNIILGNALTNAIEACRQLHDDADRYISLGMKTEGDNLCIRVTNSSPSITIGDDELPVTSKNDITHHGFGLSTVRRLAKQYNGSLLCEYADGEFTFFALMMNKF
jgi:signal transduction histidine kinase